MESRTKYAVVNSRNRVVPGAGGDGYACYKTLEKAKEKAARHFDWRVVKVVFKELEDG